MGHLQEQDKLLRAIREQAALDREAILADARLRVDEIETRTGEETAQIHARIEAEARQSLLEERDRLAGESQAATRLDRQTSRTQFLGQAFDEARQALKTLVKSSEYPEIIGALIAETLDTLGPDAQVSVAASDVTLCRTWLGQRGLQCSLKGIEADRGTVQAITPDGTRQVDNSLMARLSRVESLCGHEVAAILFEEEASPSRGGP